MKLTLICNLFVRWFYLYPEVYATKPDPEELKKNNGLKYESDNLGVTLQAPASSFDNIKNEDGSKYIIKIIKQIKTVYLDLHLWVATFHVLSNASSGQLMNLAVTLIDLWRDVVVIGRSWKSSRQNYQLAWRCVLDKTWNIATHKT